MQVLLDLVVAEVFVRELAAHEGARPVAGRDALDALQRRQVEPLVVVARAVAVGKEGRSGHVGRVLEEEQAAVTVIGHLECLARHLAHGRIAAPVMERHGQARARVTKALAAPIGLERDRQAVLLGRVGGVEARYLGLRTQRGACGRGEDESAQVHDMDSGVGSSSRQEKGPARAGPCRDSRGVRVSPWRSPCRPRSRRP